jgi:predicted nuclease with TOPRIM domain
MEKVNKPNATTTAPNQPVKKEKSKGVGAIIFLSIFALILAVGGGLLLREVLEAKHNAEKTNKEKQIIAKERDELLIQLDALEKEFQKLSVEYAELEKNLGVERGKISRLRSQLQGTGPGGDPSLQAKIDELERLLAGYQQEAEALKSENQMLAGEKSQIQNSLNQTTARNSQLEREKSEIEEQLKKASILSISNIEANGVRTKRKGDEPTNKAKRTSKIQTCFTINQNLVATPGNRDFFVRIIDPSNNVLTAFPDDTFNYQGDELTFSVQRTVSFQNNAQDICLIYSQNTKFSKGYYNIVVFSEGYELGYKLMELK